MRRALYTLLALALALGALAFVPDARPGPTGGWLRNAGLEPRFATLDDGLRLRYVRTGQGPPVLLLHGFASSIYTWKEVLRDLARDHEVVALDFPGFGGSEQPADLSFDRLPRAALGLLDALGIGRADVVGHSMGGAVAVLVAAEHPGRIGRLALLDAAGFNLTRRDRPWIVSVASSGPGVLAAETWPLRGALLRVGLRQVFFDPAVVTEQRFDEYLEPLLREGALRSAASLTRSRSLDPEDFASLAGRVRAPTLVVWGREDRWIPVAHADRFVAAIPGARKAVLERCGHIPQEERPRETLGLLAEFL